MNITQTQIEKLLEWHLDDEELPQVYLPVIVTSVDIGDMEIIAYHKNDRHWWTNWVGMDFKMEGTEWRFLKVNDIDKMKEVNYVKENHAEIENP